MRNIILALILSTVLSPVAKAQQVTFFSPEFEQGIREYLELDEEAVIQQSQLETITELSLSGRGISDISDVVYLPNLQTLDLSSNNISDLSPLLVLEKLRTLNLSDNGLEQVDILRFVRTDLLTVFLAHNRISDFTNFYEPTQCLLTFYGVDNQMTDNTNNMKVAQLYVSTDANGKSVVVYQGVADSDSQLVYETGNTLAQMDGETHQTPIAANNMSVKRVLLTNGTQEEATYVVPVSFHPTDVGETVTIPTGLPEEYHIGFVSAEYGTVVAKGTNLVYTAPAELAPDILSFSYYQGTKLRGYGHLIAGLQIGDADANGQVTITDAASIANKIMGHPSQNFNQRAADVNRDNVISVADAVGVVNIIKKNANASAQ